MSLPATCGLRRRSRRSGTPLHVPGFAALPGAGQCGHGERDQVAGEATMTDQTCARLHRGEQVKMRPRREAEEQREVVVFVPVKLKNYANGRVHWRTEADYRKRVRTAVQLCVRPSLSPRWDAHAPKVVE